jgi:hypothetical protein
MALALTPPYCEPQRLRREVLGPSRFGKFVSTASRCGGLKAIGLRVYNDGVGLTVMLAPLRMSADDGARSGVFEHLRADDAGMSAGRFEVTVLHLSEPRPE